MHLPRLASSLRCKDFSSNRIRFHVLLQAGEGLTALRFDDSGLQCAVGTTNGLVALFDLRASRPTMVKDHMYGAPIRDIKFHTADSLAGKWHARLDAFEEYQGFRSYRSDGLGYWLIFNSLSMSRGHKPEGH